MFKLRKKERCSLCFKESPVEKRDLQKKAICKKCYQRIINKKTKICIMCSKKEPCYTKDINNNSICVECYRQLIKNNLIECYICKKQGIFAKTDELNNKICIDCLRQIDRECGICKKYKKIHIIKNNIHMCRSCYRKLYTQKKEICNICKNKKIVNYRGNFGEPICSGCGAKKDICIKCGSFDNIHKRNKEQQPICKKCYNKFYKRRQNICTICNKIKKVDCCNNLGETICHSCNILNRIKTDKNLLLYVG